MVYCQYYILYFALIFAAFPKEKRKAFSKVEKKRKDE